jgi:uncharacterized membrane protein
MLRIGIGFAALALATRLGVNHGVGGLKGGYVPLENVVICVATAATMAYFVSHQWHWFPAPFVAGIVGAIFIGGIDGPYGGILGLTVGVVVVTIFGPTHQARRRKRQTDKKPVTPNAGWE